MDFVVAIITSTAGLLAILKFVIWYKNERKSNKRPLKVFVKDHNIYGSYMDGSERQLTHQSADHNPIHVSQKSKIIFLRSQHVSSDRDYVRYILMSLDSLTLEEKILADQKPFRDGLDFTFEILQPSQMTVSPDKSKVFLIIEKYATGSELVQVNIDTGKFEDLFSAETFDIIKSGRLKGKFLVGSSEIHDRGRDIYYKVCDAKGNVLKRFEDYEEYMTFRSQALIGK